MQHRPSAGRGESTWGVITEQLSRRETERMDMTGRPRPLLLASLDVGGPGGSYRKNFLRKESEC